MGPRFCIVFYKYFSVHLVTSAILCLATSKLVKGLELGTCPFCKRYSFAVMNSFSWFPWNVSSSRATWPWANLGEGSSSDTHKVLLLTHGLLRRVSLGHYSAPPRHLPLHTFGLRERNGRMCNISMPHCVKNLFFLRLRLFGQRQEKFLLKARKKKTLCPKKFFPLKWWFRYI